MSTSRLRLIHARQRRTCGVVRFAASPAYKLRRFAGEWSFRVHARSVRFGIGHATDIGLGWSPHLGGDVTFVTSESMTDWSAA